MNDDWGNVILFICQIIMSSYFIILFLFGHLYFLILVHKMNNNFDPLSLPPGGKNPNAQYTNLDYRNLNKHKPEFKV